MHRSIINSSVLRSSRLLLNQGSRRSLSSTTRTSSKTVSRWALSTSLMAIGLSSYYLTQPLFLETKKEVKESKPKAETTEVTTPETQEPKAAENEEGEKQQSAYNPETGEINWDCPCLGGMANGPCGEEFKEAFSCFIYSEADPKGFDCIEKFKNMQTCFRKYPDIYSEEIRDEENTPIESAPTDAEVPQAEAAVAVEAPLAATTTTEPLSIPSADVNPIITEQVPVNKESN